MHLVEELGGGFFQLILILSFWNVLLPVLYKISQSLQFFDEMSIDLLIVLIRGFLLLLLSFSLTYGLFTLLLLHVKFLLDLLAFAFDSLRCL